MTQILDRFNWNHWGRVNVDINFVVIGQLEPAQVKVDFVLENVDFDTHSIA
jgi:hypothetical protein